MSVESVGITVIFYWHILYLPWCLVQQSVLNSAACLIFGMRWFNHVAKHLKTFICMTGHNCELVLHFLRSHQTRITFENRSVSLHAHL